MKILTLISILIFGQALAAQSYFDSLESDELNKGAPVYWVYGLPDFERSFAREKLAAQYGFSIAHVAGCTIDEASVKRINHHNRGIQKRLAKRLGPDWKDQFDRAVDSVYLIDRAILDSFSKRADLHAMLEALTRSYRHGVELRILFTSISGQFLLTAFLRNENGDVSSVRVFSTKVDYPGCRFGKPELFEWSSR